MPGGLAAVPSGPRRRGSLSVIMVFTSVGSLT
jgi:hypothetical protein